MRCSKCGSTKFERIIIPSLPHIQVSKFVAPESYSEEPIERIKCIKCGHAFKD